MPTVFVPNQGAHDFSDAERYGTLRYVTKGMLSKHALGIMTRAWEDVLADSKPDDFILLTSLTTLCSVGCAIFAFKHGKLNLLMYRNGRYMSRTILLDREVSHEGAV